MFLDEPSIIGLFLYFPEDKTEYIPAAMTFIVFMIAAILTMRWIIRHSRKEEEKTKAFEEEIMKKQGKKG
ncbi:MAG: hypothetical protein ACI4XL_01820 [Bacillus sp. (in: firmicutes)]